MAAGSQRARMAKWAGSTKSTGAYIVVEGKLVLQNAIEDLTVLG
jgi:hypothetical protein